MAGRPDRSGAARGRRPWWLLATVLGVVVDAAALPVAEPAEVLPTPLRVFSGQPLTSAHDDDADDATPKLLAPVAPSVDVEGAEMGLIMHPHALADSQGLLSEWMADAQFVAPAEVATAGGRSDVARAPAGQRFNRQPAWVANGHEADAAVTNALNTVRRDWVAPQPGSGGLGLSRLPGLNSYLMADEPRNLPTRSADADPMPAPPLISLPGVVRAFLRDNYGFILLTVALVAGAAAAAKAYSRRI